jgi:hypothetical protein
MDSAKGDGSAGADAGVVMRCSKADGCGMAGDGCGRSCCLMGAAAGLRSARCSQADMIKRWKGGWWGACEAKNMLVNYEWTLRLAFEVGCANEEGRAAAGSRSSCLTKRLMFGGVWDGGFFQNVTTKVQWRRWWFGCARDGIWDGGMQANFWCEIPMLFEFRSGQEQRDFMDFSRLQRETHDVSARESECDNVTLGAAARRGGSARKSGKEPTCC